MSEEIKISDAAKKLAEENKIDLTTITGSGKDNAITKGDIEKAITVEDELAEDDDNEITVDDAEILKPKELPLVVKPGKKGWANEAQAEYAKTLNAYAYSNPEKFASKKDTLVSQLKALAENPSLLHVYRGGQPGAETVKYKNHVTQGNQE